MIRELLAAQARNKATMLVTTHDLDLAATISDRVAVLVAGRIVSVGDPKPVLADVERWYPMADQFVAEPEFHSA